MLTVQERRPATRTLRGWAIGAARSRRHPRMRGAWVRDRADPHSRDRAFVMAREYPPPGVSQQAAALAIAEALGSIGDTCPECPTEG